MEYLRTLRCSMEYLHGFHCPVGGPKMGNAVTTNQLLRLYMHGFRSLLITQ